MWELFIPGENAASRIEFEAALDAQNIETLHWGPVRVRPEVLGEIANSTRPAIWHVLCAGNDAARWN